MKSPGVATLSGRITRAGAAFLLALAAIGSIPTSAFAQDKPPIDQQMVNDKAKFFVRAWVNKEYGVYNEGEALTIKARCEQDAYLYILYQQCDGKIYQIFPNKFQPDNKVKAMTDVQVPEKDDGFRFFISAPLGREVIKVIASKQPIDVLSLPELKEDHFNPVTFEQLDQAGKQVGKEGTNLWSEHDIKVLTIPRGEPTVPVATKRVGVFFGVSKYEFNEAYKDAQRTAMMDENGKVDEARVQRLDLKSPEVNARDMAEVLTRVGQLSESKVFVNSEVTRARIKEMITEWLPSISKPGDTVFIYYSGHGTQIEDDDGDEKDGKDEALVPYDSSVDYFVLKELIKKFKANELPPEMGPRLKHLAQVFDEANARARAKLGGEAISKEDAIKALVTADSVLQRETLVTDDEMGHWVQKLEGRRVVVILDSCHSGGMGREDAKPNKGLGDRPAATKGFDFLTGEFTRLKDLNQPTLTVLTAAQEQESSAEITKDRNALFTGALTAILQQDDDPVDVKLAATRSKSIIESKIKMLAQILDELIKDHPEKRDLLERQKVSFSPTLFTTDPKPVYLKPPGSASKSSTPALNKD